MRYFSIALRILSLVLIPLIWIQSDLTPPAVPPLSLDMAMSTSSRLISKTSRRVQLHGINTANACVGESSNLTMRESDKVTMLGDDIWWEVIKTGLDSEVNVELDGGHKSPVHALETSAQNIGSLTVRTD
ncbi:MAG: hypothetical protein J3R72DRAFT_472396 [Linnemannia gamsii]|nr:MAG: hypothetical protein J3R72DRAFT_472396 [Linnemannia gamsii]